MQVHEITKTSTDEGLLDLAKKAGSGLVQAGKGAAKAIAGTQVAKDIAGAVKEPFQKAAAVISTPGAMTSPHAYRDAMQKFRAGQVAELEPRVQAMLNQQIAQQTSQRAKQWAQDWPKERPATGMAGTKGKAPPGGMSAPMAASKTGQQLQQMYGTPKGGIEGMKSDLEEASATDAFVSWAEAKLAGNIPVRSGLTMASVKQNLDPKEKTALSTLAARVNANPDDLAAVQQYLQTYMQAMQRVSQDLKQSRRTATARPNAEGILARYGVDDVVIEKLKSLAKEPTYAAAIKKELGIP